jgi:hypothetical protein
VCGTGQTSLTNQSNNENKIKQDSNEKRGSTQKMFSGVQASLLTGVVGAGDAQGYSLLVDGDLGAHHAGAQRVILELGERGAAEQSRAA